MRSFQEPKQIFSPLASSSNAVTLHEWKDRKNEFETKQKSSQKSFHHAWQLILLTYSTLRNAWVRKRERFMFVNELCGCVGPSANFWMDYISDRKTCCNNFHNLASWMSCPFQWTNKYVSYELRNIYRLLLLFVLARKIEFLFGPNYFFEQRPVSKISDLFSSWSTSLAPSPNLTSFFKSLFFFFHFSPKMRKKERSTDPFYHRKTCRLSHKTSQNTGQDCHSQVEKWKQ